MAWTTIFQNYIVFFLSIHLSQKVLRSGCFLLKYQHWCENITQSQSIHKLRATCNRDTWTFLEAICLKNEKKYFFFLFFISVLFLFSLSYIYPFKKSMALECGSLSNLNRNLLYILINLNSDIDRSLLLNFVQRFVWEKRKIRIYQNVLHHLCSVSDNFVIAAIRHV